MPARTARPPRARPGLRTGIEPGALDGALVFSALAFGVLTFSALNFCTRGFRVTAL